MDYLHGIGSAKDKILRTDTEDLGPRDMMDIQSFMWVLGSAEYA